MLHASRVAQKYDVSLGFFGNSNIQSLESDAEVVSLLRSSGDAKITFVTGPLYFAGTPVTFLNTTSQRFQI